MSALSAPIDQSALQSEQAVVVVGTVNGQGCTFVLDTGDAVGPVFSADDARRLGLQRGQPLGVSGAGGAATIYETTADVGLRGTVFHGEPCAIDANLAGQSLIGLPWFVAKCQWFMIDFDSGELVCLLR